MFIDHVKVHLEQENGSYQSILLVLEHPKSFGVFFFLFVTLLDGPLLQYV